MMADLLDKYTGSYALVVGIDHYPDPRFSPLGNAEADALEVMEVLAAPPYRFEVSGLFGEQATRRAILDRLFDLESTAPNDRVIFYFAGHGYTLVDNFDRESGYLACFDTIPERHHTALRMDDVVDFRARAGAKHIAFIFDACFSGQALGLTRSAAVAAGRFMKLRAYHAISAGGPGETVADAQSMTRLLVEALRHPERVDPKLLTIEKLGAHLRERMVGESRSIQTPQFGQLSGSGGGDMVLVAVQPGETADVIFSVLPGPFDWVQIPRGVVIPRSEHAPIYLPDTMISKYPVTNDQFQTFVEAPDGYVDVRWWDYSAEAMQWRLSASPSIPPRPDSPGDHPRVDVSWYAAVAFCRWLSRQVPYEVRLAGEREWIRAARGDDDRPYPWGSGEPGDQHANCCGRVGGTTPVRHYPDGASPFGVEDMAGNVWEWCIEDYGTQIRDLDFKSRFRSIRGGCYKSSEKFLRIDACHWHDPAEGSDTLGFRLVRAILPGG